MDLGTAVIGAIAIAACLLPFLLSGKGRSNKEKQLLQSLLNSAQQRNCTISQHEFCGDVIIGIDEQANCVFYDKNVKNVENLQYIDLKEIRQCKVVSTSRNAKTNNGAGKIIDKLELRFSPIIETKPEISLVFHNSDENPQFHGEVQIVDKWAKMINERLNVLKGKNTVA